MNNSIEFKVWGKYALFTDPITKIGGEKSSYHIPTYEGIKGITKSIYWKPTIIWVIDKVRVMKRIRTETKGMKPMKYSDGRKNDLAIYNYLANVEYQVQAHFEWNEHREELYKDRIDGKHYAIAMRSLERGGRQDIFLGCRECQGYVEPCVFGEGASDLGGDGELSFGVMFHSFGYPDETGNNELVSRFWSAKMTNGVIEFPNTDECKSVKKICKMLPKKFEQGENFSCVSEMEEIL